jgi:phosphate acetyltransferase
VLLGKREVIERWLRRRVTLPAGLEILDPMTIRHKYVAPMVELRKAKGLTRNRRSWQLEDTVVLGTMMLAVDEVDGLVSGAVHTTANTVRPACS